MEKYFIITIDTEADNQWDTNHECSTNNAKYLPRFQELAEKYQFKPVFLTTYEMANDNFYIKYFKKKQDNNLCEIGMHLHAWNTPPNFDIEKKTSERAFLIEYPLKIMEEKIYNLDKLLKEKFNIKPISHRSGRWIINEEYLELLDKYGYKIDCSVTPHINWYNSLGQTGVHGIDYSNYSEKSSMIYKNVFEVPMTIKKIHYFDKIRNVSIIKLLKNIAKFIYGKNQWVRPDASLNNSGIIKVIDRCNKKNEYIMFMIHSSELMPGGSPYFKSEQDIESLYINIEKLFKYIKSLGYQGITLRDYYKRVNR